MIWITQTSISFVPIIGPLMHRMSAALGADSNITHMNLEDGWYIQTGEVLITSMIIAVFTPQIDLVVDFTLKSFLRIYDKGILNWMGC